MVRQRIQNEFISWRVHRQVPTLSCSVSTRLTFIICVVELKLCFWKLCFSRLAGFWQAKVNAHMWNTRFSNAFSVCQGNLLFLKLLFCCSPMIMFVPFVRPWLLPPLDRSKANGCPQRLSYFPRFGWLIFACLTKSAGFIKDLYPSTLLCSTWFTPGISPGRS